MTSEQQLVVDTTKSAKHPLVKVNAVSVHYNVELAPISSKLKRKLN